MKQSAKRLHRQRAQLDAKFGQLRRFVELAAAPRSGWVRAIRESIGMTAQQLAARLAITKQTVAELELNEREKKITLGSLEAAARALNCRLVYALVPTDSLEERVDKRARAMATRMLARVDQSMRLEAAEPNAWFEGAQTDELARSLKEKLKPALWNDR